MTEPKVGEEVTVRFRVVAVKTAFNGRRVAILEPVGRFYSLEDRPVITLDARAAVPAARRRRADP